jgi:glycosyltransferase involved in cell wall biosynthesis
MRAARHGTADPPAGVSDADAARRVAASGDLGAPTALRSREQAGDGRGGPRDAAPPDAAQDSAARVSRARCDGATAGHGADPVHPFIAAIAAVSMVAPCGGGDPADAWRGAAPPSVPDQAAGTASARGTHATAVPRILLLSAAHPPADTRVVRKEGAALVAAGFDVLHLCPGGSDAPALVDGVRIVTHRHRRLRGLLALARAAAALRPDAIHASEPDAWLAALLAARRCGARVVLDVHEHYPSRLDARLPGWLRPAMRAAISRACGWMGRLADAVVVAKDGLDAPFAGARLVAVRNYAPAPVLAPRAHAGGPVTLVHLGALGRARGWPQMLDALALCGPGTRLLLVGRFTDGSAEAFHARAAALGLAQRIEVTGWLPQDEALARLNSADIALVLFQRGEENHRLALPHKLFDAMAAGLPVVAPIFAEEVAQVVRDAGCGLLVETGDAAAIAQAIAALADPARRAAMGVAGWQAARDRFAWEPEAARLVALHRALVASRLPA